MSFYYYPYTAIPNLNYPCFDYSVYNGFNQFYNFAIPHQQNKNLNGSIQQNLPIKRQNDHQNQIVTPIEREPSISKPVIDLDQISNSDSEKIVPFAQKQNRNVISNILRSFFKKINFMEYHCSQIEKIIQKYKLQTTSEEFFHWFNQLKIDYKVYIKSKLIFKLFRSRLNQNFILILKVLLNKYCDQDAILQVMTSKKIGRNSIKNHIEGLRRLRKKLLSREK